jgi:transcriptional regulator
MFVPSQYREPDGSWMVELLHGNPLALLVTNGGAGDVPFATHLPVIPDPAMAAEHLDDLVGAVLLGHLNRGNPHWKALADGAAALLNFTGPHAYVSPTVYEQTPSAPTWDFTSVHVRGIIEKIDSADETLGVVQATVRAFEARFGTGWDMSASIDYFHKLLPAVGAFRLTVVGVDGMFKLSQEQPREVRDRVRQSFERCEFGPHREVAELMRRLA